MDKVWKNMIESNVYDYISKIDYTHPDFSMHEFKSELNKIIGLTPAVKMKWNTIEQINELKRDSGAKDYKKILEKVEEINIVFVDNNNIPIEFKFIL